MEEKGVGVFPEGVIDVKLTREEMVVEAVSFDWNRGALWFEQNDEVGAAVANGGTGFPHCPYGIHPPPPSPTHRRSTLPDNYHPQTLLGLL